MPTTLEGWLFWIFSVLVVGLILSVMGNLITPLVKERGAGWLQRRRLRRQEYREQLIELGKRMKRDPNLAFFEFGPRLLRSALTTMGGLMLLLFVAFIGLDELASTQIGSFLILIGVLLIIAGYFELRSTLNRVVDVKRLYKDDNRQGNV